MTSREEMQSLNEELTTVNAQLQAKMEEHQAANNDMASLLTSTDIAVLFLDTRFRIRRYTPAVRELIELIASDVGRPLGNLARKCTDPHLDAGRAERGAGQARAPVEKQIEGEVPAAGMAATVRRRRRSRTGRPTTGSTASSSRSSTSPTASVPRRACGGSAARRRGSRVKLADALHPAGRPGRHPGRGLSRAGRAHARRPPACTTPRSSRTAITPSKAAVRTASNT